MQIPYELKCKCVKLAETQTARAVYDSTFQPEHDGMSFETFKRKLRMWKRKCMADDDTLEAGTYGGFVAHNATVQIDGNGVVKQAWIKQTAGDDQWDRLLEAIKESIVPEKVEPKRFANSHGMLECGLYDMHFGLASLEYYRPTLQEMLGIVEKQYWREINIVIGQDLLHNDAIDEGRTTKGTAIEKVDMVKAWEDAKAFYVNVINSALCFSERVVVKYSVGNHDKSMAWAFAQLLKAMFPNVEFDDSLEPRKVIYWEGCFVGICHGCETKSYNNDLRSQFTIEFPEQFAKAKVREIHAGHLHHEREADLYGVMIRRLSSGVPTDTWSNNSGYIGAHKRFQLFEYEPNKLKAIYYI